ncbi:MAG: hypothetical protein R2777_09175 [Chitinophagales bacterium]
MKPTTFKDEDGVIIAAIETYGDTIHKFVERKNYKGAFFKGFKAKKSNFEIKPTGLSMLTIV